MIDNQILSCPNPFCGGEGRIRVHKLVYDATIMGWSVICKRCNVSTSRFPAEAAAIAAWNERPAPTLPWVKIENEQQYFPEIFDVIILTRNDFCSYGRFDKSGTEIYFRDYDYTGQTKRPISEYFGKYYIVISELLKTLP